MSNDIPSEEYEKPIVMNEDTGVQPIMLVVPVLVAAGIFYTVGAVVQAVVAVETAAVAAVAAIAGAVTYIGNGETC